MSAVACPSCTRTFADENALRQHARAKHGGAEKRLPIRIACPRCGGVALNVQTQFGLRSSCCGLWSWHGKPLADAATHETRKAAHAAFDPIWQSGRVSRSQAYAMLVEELGLPAWKCHMGTMSAEVASRVPEAARCILSRLRSSVDREVEVA